jgi:tRNA1(Val) A37 N6-methylase TrmN6
MPNETLASDITEDAVLGGRLRLRQPRRGHRVGHDAILLAAAAGGRVGEHAVDLGAGIGGAGLALAARATGIRVTLVEIDPALSALAAENARLNGLADRVRCVTVDVTAPPDAFAAAGLAPGSASRVMMNPPFSDPARQTVSPDPRRRLAHAAGTDTLAQWIATAARLLATGGVLTMIWRADGLDAVLTELAAQFGGVAVLPVHPRADAPAIRILVRAVKGSSAPLALYPGLVLSEKSGRPAAAAEDVLREGKVLPLAEL